MSRGTNMIGQPGEAGTIHFDLNKEGLADLWLANQTGIESPGPEDWLRDYDNDGLSARLEFALGGSTSEADHEILPRFVPRENGTPEFTFNRRRGGGLCSTDYTVQISSNLSISSWQPLLIDESLTLPHPILEGFDQVTVVLPGNLPRNFIRLKIR
jgi:hypothetical protein